MVNLRAIRGLRYDQLFPNFDSNFGPPNGQLHSRDKQWREPLVAILVVGVRSHNFATQCYRIHEGSAVTNKLPLQVFNVHVPSVSTRPIVFIRASLSSIRFRLLARTMVVERTEIPTSKPSITFFDITFACPGIRLSSLA
jgi:hypothetical protein